VESKSQSWEVSDDKKAAEEIPGAPAENMSEGQVKVVSDHQLDEDLSGDVIPDGGNHHDVSPDNHHHHDVTPVDHHDVTPVDYHDVKPVDHHDIVTPDDQHDIMERHHAAEHENAHNERSAEQSMTSDERVDQVTSAVDNCAISGNEDDEQQEPVDVDIVWEYGGNEVFVIAAFTDWQPAPLYFSDGVHKATFAVARGRHSYKFVVDGDEKVDESRDHDDDHNILHV